MYNFFYDPKGKTVYVSVGVAKGDNLFRSANDSATRKLNAKAAQRLLPLVESEKMKENGWRSRYFLELPYGEAWDFQKWLEENFRGTRYSFEVRSIGSSIHINTHYTHNEVNEPFADCEACLAKDVLKQVCEILVRLYEEEL